MAKPSIVVAFLLVGIVCATCPCPNCPSGSNYVGACCHGNTTCETQNWSPTTCTPAYGTWCPWKPAGRCGFSCGAGCDKCASYSSSPYCQSNETHCTGDCKGQWCPLAGGNDVLETVVPTRAAPAVVDVIIVGAGWSGMGAADHLARNKNNVTFKILEARNETGGRTRALSFGDDSVGKFVVERGSNWVCGVGGGLGGNKKKFPNMKTNPMYDLAVRANLKTTLIPGSTQNMSNYAAVFDADGKSADPTGELRKRANAALDRFNATVCGKNAPGFNATTTVREALQQCGWDPKTELEWAVDWVATVDDPGVPAELQAANAFGCGASYQWWGKDDEFVVDQNPRGYAKLMDVMVEDTIPPGDERIVFNSKVVKIAYDCEGASVTTSDGVVHRAKEVICTLPLGVLQRVHDTMFDPPMPATHTEVLTSDGIVMANLTHVLLQLPKDYTFPEKWQTIPRWVSAIKGAHDTKSSGEFSEWQNLNHPSMIPGSQILLSFLGDPQSSYYEGLPDAQVQAAAMKALRGQNPDLTIPDPVAFFLSRHGYDELSYGAYSGFELGWKDKFIATLKAPLEAKGCKNKSGKKKRVRFAGEAMCDDLSGFTHGGRQSGVEVAAGYLYHAGLGPNPSDSDNTNICWW